MATLDAETRALATNLAALIGESLDSLKSIAQSLRYLSGEDALPGEAVDIEPPQEAPIRTVADWVQARDLRLGQDVFVRLIGAADGEWVQVADNIARPGAQRELHLFRADMSQVVLTVGGEVPYRVR